MSSDENNESGLPQSEISYLFITSDNDVILEEFDDEASEMRVQQLNDGLVQINEVIIENCGNEVASEEVAQPINEWVMVIDDDNTGTENASEVPHLPLNGIPIPTDEVVFQSHNDEGPSGSFEEHVISLHPGCSDSSSNGESSSNLAVAGDACPHHASKPLPDFTFDIEEICQKLHRTVTDSISQNRTGNENDDQVSHGDKFQMFQPGELPEKIDAIEKRLSQHRRMFLRLARLILQTLSKDNGVEKLDDYYVCFRLMMEEKWQSISEMEDLRKEGRFKNQYNHKVSQIQSLKTLCDDFSAKCWLGFFLARIQLRLQGSVKDMLPKIRNLHSSLLQTYDRRA